MEFFFFSAVECPYRVVGWSLGSHLFRVISWSTSFAVTVRGIALSTEYYRSCVSGDFLRSAVLVLHFDARRVQKFRSFPSELTHKPGTKCESFTRHFGASSNEIF